MVIPENKREESIKASTLRSELVDLLLKKRDFGRFSHYFEKPTYFYSRAYPDEPGAWLELGNKELIPLWEYSEEVFALDLLSNKVISFYIECPDEYEVLNSIDHAIFGVIEHHTWETGGSDQEVRESIEFANKIGLPNMPGLEKLFSNYMQCTEEMIAEYRETL